MRLFGISVLASSVWKTFAGAPPEALTMGVVGFAALAAIMAVLALQGAAAVVMQARAELPGATA